MRVAERASGLLRTGAVIAVAMGVMNVATYGFTMIAAHLLGPLQYGGFVAVMNVLLVVSVASLGLQATGARRISSSPQHLAQIERTVMRVSYRAALALGVLLLALAPVIDRVLRLDNLAAALVVGLAAVPLTVMGGQAGILQGERRWAPLALLYLAAGVPRLVVGTALLFWTPTPFWALVGVLVGMWVPVVVGWWVLRPVRPAGERSEEHRGTAILRESVHNSQALLAYFALSNVDIVVARQVLDEHTSGLYASGLILAKAMLFLPQFVVVLAFPAMATVAQRRRALTGSLALVAGLGVVGTLAAWLLADVALVFVGGSEYADVRSRLWLFAILGTLLSMIQLVVYSVIARQGQRSIWFIWAALVAVVTIGLSVSSILGLVTTVILVDLGLLVVLVGLSAWLMRDSVGGVVPAASGADRDVERDRQLGR